MKKQKNVSLFWVPEIYERWFPCSEFYWTPYNKIISNYKLYPIFKYFSWVSVSFHGNSERKQNSAHNFVNLEKKRKSCYILQAKK